MKNNNKLPDFDILAPLETFDPNVFNSDNEGEQKICEFILSISLIYNDFKNLVWASHNILNNCEQGEKLTAYHGQHSGFRIHIDKLLYSLMRELFQLIKQNESVLIHILFLETINRLSKEARESWQSLIDFSQNKEIKNKKLKMFFERIRHKTAYHLDPKDIMAGYNYFFFSKDTNMQAYISRGNALSENRFYFADAAVQGYIELRFKEVKETGINILEIVKDINLAIYEIVTKFINIRGYAFRKIME